MTVLIALLLALIPAGAILYPILRRRVYGESFDDENSPRVELVRRWDSALAGLKSAELEWAIDNLSEKDYVWIREHYMIEAASVMKAMRLKEDQELELLPTNHLDINRDKLSSWSSEDDAGVVDG